MPRVIRVLIHYYADDDHEARHVYLVDAAALLAYAIVAFRREREYATWAVRARPEPSMFASLRPPTAVSPRQRRRTSSGRISSIAWLSHG